MWNETAMHHHHEDGRGQLSAWTLTLALFAILMAGSLCSGGAEPDDPAGRLPARIAVTDAVWQSPPAPVIERQARHPRR